MADKQYFQDQLIEKYNIFLQQIEYLIPVQEVKDEVARLNKESNEKKYENVLNFVKQLDTTTDEYKEQFIARKTKIFSSKNEITNNLSTSIFGNIITLKRIFNREDTKDALWEYLFIFYLYAKMHLGENDDKLIGEITNILANSVNKQKIKNNLLNVEVDATTNQMIEDIASSFKQIVDTNNISNPMETIMNITQNITDKYQDKIINGEIDLTSLVNDLQSQMPGVSEIMKGIVGSGQNNKKKEKVVIDENFSTSQVKAGEDAEESGGLNITSMMKMFKNMGLDTKQLTGMFDVMNQASNCNDEEAAKKLQDQMQEMMKETLNVDMEKLVGKNKKNNKTLHK